MYTCAGMEEVEVGQGMGLNSEFSKDSIMRETEVVVKHGHADKQKGGSGMGKMDGVVVNVECGVKGGGYTWASKE